MTFVLNHRLLDFIGIAKDAIRQIVMLCFYLHVINLISNLLQNQFATFFKSLFISKENFQIISYMFKDLSDLKNSFH